MQGHTSHLEEALNRGLRMNPSPLPPPYCLPRVNSWQEYTTLRHEQTPTACCQAEVYVNASLRTMNYTTLRHEQTPTALVERPKYMF